LFVIVLAAALAAAVEDDEVPAAIDIGIPEGRDTGFVHVGDPIQLNASVNGTSGSDLTNSSSFSWQVYPDLVSWIPRAHNVIDIYPEAEGELTVTVVATFNGHNVTRSMNLTLVRAVEDVRLAFDPPRGLIYHGDQVFLAVTLLDWRGNPIDVEADFCWSVDAGFLTHTPGHRRVSWMVEELGLHTITVEYTIGPQFGSASYTIDVQRKVSAIQLGTVPSEVEIFSSFNLSIKVLDSTGADVTKIADVSLILVEGNVSDVRWTWDTCGTMNINPVIPRQVLFLVVADLNGSNLQVPQSFRVTGSLPDEAEEVPEILEIIGFVPIAIVIMSTILILALMFYRLSFVDGHLRDELEELYTRSSGNPMSRKRAKMERDMPKRYSKFGIDIDTVQFNGSDDDAEDDL